MNLARLEIWVHDTILKNESIRHFIYTTYQHLLRLFSEKMYSEGNIFSLVPDDEYEYLFGYYDKCPWSEDGKKILALRVSKAYDCPDSTEEATIVIISLDSGDIEELATTRTWNVQQGCMAQWFDNHRILFNDFRDNKYCSVIRDIASKKDTVYPIPVYSVSQDKKIALSLDFSRLHRLRLGYGYANLPDVYNNVLCPDSTCIWSINYQTGHISSVLKYTDLANFEPREEMKGAEHKVNHIMINPSGKRFMFLHRWFKNGVKYTRLLTCDIDGGNMYNLSDDDFVSHCCWKNDHQILSYLNKKEGGKGYYLLNDMTSSYVHVMNDLILDGHPTYSYDGSKVVTDTYADRKRLQSIYVVDNNQISRVARVFLPFKYNYDVRCDLHPRWSHDGSQICFDSAFEGKRKMYAVKLYDCTDGK